MVAYLQLEMRGIRRIERVPRVLMTWNRGEEKLKHPGTCIPHCSLCHGVSVTAGPLGPRQFKFLAAKGNAFQCQTGHCHILGPRGLTHFLNLESWSGVFCVFGGTHRMLEFELTSLSVPAPFLNTSFKIVWGPGWA